MRRRAILLFAAIAALAAALPMSAIRTDGTTVIIPVVGRFAGSFGSDWVTDIFLVNHNSVSKNVIMTFYVAGGAPVERTLSIGAFSTMTINDVIYSTFGRLTAGGVIELTTTSDSPFEARARIYNVGSAAGEYGQNVPGIGMSYLSKQAVMGGLSGINGNRLNAGVTNPTDARINVTMRMTDEDNLPLHTETFPVDPHQNVQFNDVFARFGVTPRSGVQIEFVGTDVIYGYASEARNDSGDAIFVFGTAPND